MSITNTLTTRDHLTLDQWLQIRKEEGLKINPEAAVVWWKYADPLDPYSVNPDLPEECRQIGRAYFARSPGSDIWVSFSDLPDIIRHALWEKDKAGQYDDDPLDWLFDD